MTNSKANWTRADYKEEKSQNYLTTISAKKIFQSYQYRKNFLHKKIFKQFVQQIITPFYLSNEIKEISKGRGEISISPQTPSGPKIKENN